MRRRSQGFPAVTELWDPVPKPLQQPKMGAWMEEAILRNTFINAQMVYMTDP